MAVVAKKLETVVRKRATTTAHQAEQNLVKCPHALIRAMSEDDQLIFLHLDAFLMVFKAVVQQIVIENEVFDHHRSIYRFTLLVLSDKAKYRFVESSISFSGSF